MLCLFYAQQANKTERWEDFQKRQKNSLTFIISLLTECWHNTDTTQSKLDAKSVKNSKSQVDIFALEINKQTDKQKNKSQTQVKDKKIWIGRHEKMDYLFSKCACVNVISFVPTCISMYHMKQNKAFNNGPEPWKECFRNNACAIVKSTLYKDTIEGTKWRK